MSRERPEGLLAGETASEPSGSNWYLVWALPSSTPFLPQHGLVRLWKSTGPVLHPPAARANGQEQDFIYLFSKALSSDGHETSGSLYFSLLLQGG